MCHSVGFGVRGGSILIFFILRLRKLKPRKCTLLWSHRDLLVDSELGLRYLILSLERTWSAGWWVRESEPRRHMREPPIRKKVPGLLFAQKPSAGFLVLVGLGQFFLLKSSGLQESERLQKSLGQLLLTKANKRCLLRVNLDSLSCKCLACL